MRLGPLFHWSPRERRNEVRRHGLLPFSRPVCHGDPNLGSPYLCFGTSPSLAWGYSGDALGSTEYEEWDLWQVELLDTDPVHVVPFWGASAKEIRVTGPIAAERLWFVGTRSPAFFEPLPPEPVAAAPRGGKAKGKVKGRQPAKRTAKR